jgi:hypothetical protein
MSHMESFDPKPALNQYAGKTIAETPYADVQNPKRLAIERLVVPDGNGNQRNTLYPLQVGFQKRGDSGIEVSDWFPHIGGQVDQLAVIRSMWTTDSNHGAQTQFHSGRHQKDGHYLGPAHDATPLRVDPANPLDFSRPERELSSRARKSAVDLLQQLNSGRARRAPEDAAIAARVASYELAFRMQRSVPEAVDFSTETAETQALYGLDRPHCRDFGMQLLATRRLIERGVRFVQVQHGAGGAGSWDAHGGLKGNHERNALAVDQPVAGLLEDLRRRGLLDDTLVLFASEFGRTPGSQGTDGRDHHIFGFSVWMAGSGIRGGMVHGATDEIGFHAVEDRHYVTDIHATIMHLLGLDSRRLELPGRKRLDLDHGEVIRQILA